MEDGRSRRIADEADLGLERLNWADSGPTWVASGRTGVQPKAVFAWRAGNQLHCPKQTYGSRDSSACASAISGISGVGEKPSSAGARTAWASAGRSVNW